MRVCGENRGNLGRTLRAGRLRERDAEGMKLPVGPGGQRGELVRALTPWARWQGARAGARAERGIARSGRGPCAAGSGSWA